MAPAFFKIKAMFQHFLVVTTLRFQLALQQYRRTTLEQTERRSGDREGRPGLPGLEAASRAPQAASLLGPFGFKSVLES